MILDFFALKKETKILLLKKRKTVQTVYRFFLLIAMNFNFIKQISGFFNQKTVIILLLTFYDTKHKHMKVHIILYLSSLTRFPKVRRKLIGMTN